MGPAEPRAQGVSECWWPQIRRHGSDGRSRSVGRTSLFERPREQSPQKPILPQRSRGSDRHKSRECEGLFKNRIPPSWGGSYRLRGGFGVLLATGHLAGRGARSSARGASLSSGRCCLSGFTRPAPRCKPAIGGQCRRVSSPSGRLWKVGARCEVSGRGVALRQRQQADALQTLRDLGGAVQGRGSA